MKLPHLLLCLFLLSGILVAANLKGHNRLFEGHESYRMLVKFKPEAMLDVTEGKVSFFCSSRVVDSSIVTLISTFRCKQVFQYSDEERALTRSRKRLRTSPGTFNKGLFTGLTGLIELIDAPKMNKHTLLELVNKLELFDIIDYCDLSPMTPNPNPSTPDLTEYQTYRNHITEADINLNNSRTQGINMNYAWELGLKGKGIKVADIEYAWCLDHEELINQSIYNPTESGYTGYQSPEHGTAVAGILIAEENGFGMTGLVPEVEFGAFAQIPLSRPEAIGMAMNWLSAGDVIMYEMQATGRKVDGQKDRYVAIDYEPAVWDITKVATDAGIIVVEAAGNGSENLDIDHYKDYRARGDNGAIIVGAGTLNNQRRLGFSCYGSPVHVQAWGERVATISWSRDLYNPGDNLNFYTGFFGGTSSATPIVASAVVAIQCYAQKYLNRTISPREMRTLLIETGTPQDSEDTKHIGPLPNVKKAIEELSKGVSVQKSTLQNKSLLPLVTMNRESLTFTITSTAEYSITLCKVNGQKVLQTKKSFNTGKNTIPIPTLSSGVYLISVSGNGYNQNYTSIIKD